MHPILTRPLSLLGLQGPNSPALELVCLVVLYLLPPGLWFVRKWKLAANASAKAAEQKARNRLAYRLVQDHLDRRLDELLANLLSMQYDISEIRARGSLDPEPVTPRRSRERKSKSPSAV